MTNLRNKHKVSLSHHTSNQGQVSTVPAGVSAGAILDLDEQEEEQEADLPMTSMMKVLWWL